MSLDQLGQSLARAQPLPVVALVLSVLGSLLTRAGRWQVYFRPDRRVPFRPLLSTLAISYMASTFLPFRAGELVRAVFLGHRERVPVPRVVGTILLEKLFDFLAIGVMLVLLVATTPLPDLVRAAGSSIALVILVGFGFVMALAIWREPTLALVRRFEHSLPRGLGHRLRLERSARQFAEGTDSLRLPGLWAALIGWTAFTWVFSIGSAWAGTSALGLAPGLAALVFATVLTSTGQAVPSSPGYVGVYHAAATVALVAFGVDQTSAFAAAVLTWAFSYGALVVVGLLALWLDGYSFGDLLGAVRGGTAARPRAAPLVADRR